MTALHTACGSCQADSARLLVETYGRNLNAMSAKTGMALHEALDACALDIVRMFVTNGADVNTAEQSPGQMTNGWRPCIMR